MSARKRKAPNIIIILADDMGYSDIGCYGGEIDTPNLDSLAEGGLRFTNFYNTARCSPSRASLLTGLHPHQTDVGLLVSDHSPEGYSGNLNKDCVTIAEVLKENGYNTYMSGKWHVTNDVENENESWPKNRGFEEVYSMLCGASSYFYPKYMVRGNQNIEPEIKQDEEYYLTDAISDQAVKFIEKHFNSQKDQNPFFMYVTYNAPHWPLHAKPEDIENYKGKFDEGWDKLREKRVNRMKELGIIGEGATLTDRDPDVKTWSDVKNKDWEVRRMETYAAMVDSMDQGIGSIVDSLRRNEAFEDTLILFLSDNGGCAEDLKPWWGYFGLGGSGARSLTRNGQKVCFGNIKKILAGPDDTFQSCGQAWANLSNTPFRLYKHWTHEGGIATPFIAHWPKGITDKGGIRKNMAQLTDIMATVIDITGFEYPKHYDGRKIHPLEGTSMMPVFRGEDNGKQRLFFEHEGNGCVRDKKWKLVRDFPFDWELYDIENDSTELHDVIDKHPKIAEEMLSDYNKWAERVGVVDFYDIMGYEIRNKVSFLPKWIRRWVAKYLVSSEFCHKKWRKQIEKEKER